MHCVMIAPACKHHTNTHTIIVLDQTARFFLGDSFHVRIIPSASLSLRSQLLRLIGFSPFGEISRFVSLSVTHS